MGSDVYIEIFGKIESADAMSALASAATEGGTDWGTFLTSSEAIEAILSAGDNGEKLELMANDMENLFVQVTSACRAHGLSYVLQAGEGGEEGYYRMEAWEPGMDQPYTGTSSDAIPMVSLTDLKEALGKGVDAVRAMVEDLDRRTLYHVTDRRIEVSPEVREAFTAAALKV